MKNTLIVYDFETVHSGKINPMTDQPIQLAAIAINSNTLEFKSDGEFNSFIRPESFAEISDKSIEWHAVQRKCSPQDILDILTKAPPLGTVINNFVQYLSIYNYRKSKFTAPIRCGANIRKYDDVIWERLRQQFNISDDEGFHPRDSLDLLDIFFLWFESLPKPEKYNLESIRNFLGMPHTMDHDALQDCRDVGVMLVKFLKLHRRVAPTVKFEGSCKE